jgi:hypothetical protein
MNNVAAVARFHRRRGRHGMRVALYIIWMAPEIFETACETEITLPRIERRLCAMEVSCLIAIKEQIGAAR